MTAPTVWRYGMRLARSTGGSTANGFSHEGCINMLGHQMDDMFRASGRCTCTAYRPDRIDRTVPEGKRCDPCKELLAAKAALESKSEVEFDGHTYFYAESEA